MRSNILFRVIGLFVAVAFSVLLANGCVWDKETDLRPEPEPSDCPTDTLTYAHIEPLIETHCLGCHADEVEGGGIFLRDYEEVSRQIQRGLLVGAVSRDPLFEAMPPTYSLESCQIDSIKAWVEAGAPR